MGPCKFIWVCLTAALSTGVAAMSSLAQLRVRDIKEQRRHKCEADRELKCQNSVATRDAYRAYM